MKQKLALIIALAGFAVVTALGVGMSGADPSAGLGDSEAANGLTNTPTLPAAKPTCPTEDDDGDELVDLEDPDCESASDTTEEPEAAAPGEGAEAPVEAAKPNRAKVQSGASLDASAAPEASPDGGVRRNQSLGGGTESGGVSAPSATAGDQPQAKSSDGGSQFGGGAATTSANPTTTIAPSGPAPLGVPNFVIDSFEIPPFLLPIYQACGTEYGIPWEVLASINKIETAFGTNLNVSSAGAMGWMQFIPSSWDMYGVDANGDGRKDPYNPVDAICSAAR